MGQCTEGISNPFIEQGDQGWGENTLRREKTGGGIRDTGSWGVDSTQELKDFTEEPRNHHQGVQEALHGLFLREGNKWEWRGKFHSGRS
jgi:hypothetical protein